MGLRGFHCALAYEAGLTSAFLLCLRLPEYAAAEGPFYGNDGNICGGVCTSQTGRNIFVLQPIT